LGRQFITLRSPSSCFSFQSFSLPEKDKEKGFPLQSGAFSQPITLRYPTIRKIPPTVTLLPSLAQRRANSQWLFEPARAPAERGALYIYVYPTISPTSNFFPF